MAHNRYGEAAFWCQRRRGARVVSHRCKDGEARGSHLVRPFLGRKLSLWILGGATGLGYISATFSLPRGINMWIFGYGERVIGVHETGDLPWNFRWERVDFMWLEHFWSAPLGRFLLGTSETLIEVVESRSEVGDEVTAWVVIVWCRDVRDFDN